MVEPLTSIAGTCHPLGNEFHLSWTYPVALPTNYQLIIFKHTKAITNEQIVSYFAGEPTILSVSVFEPDITGVRYEGIIDMEVDTGKHYYYRLLIRDKDSGEYSDTVDIDKLITSNYVPRTIDCKALVAEAIRRIFNNFNMKEWDKYELRLQWTLETIKGLTIYVVRTQGSVAQRYMGDMIKNTGNKHEYGQTDIENIEVTWGDTNHKRIDEITNIFRGSRSLIKRFLTYNGVQDVEIVMGGDSIDASFKDRIQPMASMLVQCTLEAKEDYEFDIVHAIKGQELTIGD